MAISYFYLTIYMITGVTLKTYLWDMLEKKNVLNLVVFIGLFEELN